MWRIWLDLFVLAVVIAINLAYTEFRNMSIDAKIWCACFTAVGFVYLILSKPWNKNRSAPKDGGYVKPSEYFIPCVGCQDARLRLNDNRGRRTPTHLYTRCHICNSYWVMQLGVDAFQDTKPDNPPRFN